MGGVGAILQYSDCYPSFQTFGIKLYEPIGNKLGWDPVEGEGKEQVLISSLPAIFTHLVTSTFCNSEVLFCTLYFLSLWMKPYYVTIQMKAISRAVLSCVTIYDAVEGGSSF